MPHYIHTYNIPTLILLSKTEETLSFLSIDDFEHNTGKPILPSTLCFWTNQPHNFRSAIISTTYIIIQASLPQQILQLSMVNTKLNGTVQCAHSVLKERSNTVPCG